MTTRPIDRALEDLQDWLESHKDVASKDEVVKEGFEKAKEIVKKRAVKPAKDKYRYDIAEFEDKVLKLEDDQYLRTIMKDTSDGEVTVIIGDTPSVTDKRYAEEVDGRP